MKLGYTILYVPDVTKTVAFYEAAFGFAVRFVDDGGDYGELDTGATTLSFASHRQLTTLGKHPKAADPSGPTFELALVTDDVAAGVARAVGEGATPKMAPTQMPWGQTIAYVVDPNGFLVEICTPVGGRS